jgi:hypothetical protein
MHKKWLVVVICIVPAVSSENKRDWQTGQIIETRVEQTTRAWGSILNQKTALIARQVYSIESADRDFLVAGPVTGRKGALNAGMTVRFAVEGKTMFILAAGKEYRLAVDQVRMAPPRNGDTPQPAGPESASSAPIEKPASEAEQLDNDAVVKMIVGGLKEDTVIRVIEARPGKFALGPDALQALRAAGVPQNVIAAMSAKMSTQH